MNIPGRGNFYHRIHQGPPPRIPAWMERPSVWVVIAQEENPAGSSSLNTCTHSWVVGGGWMQEEDPEPQASGDTWAHATAGSFVVSFAALEEDPAE
jgi:hypothetical protein